MSRTSRATRCLHIKDVPPNISSAKFEDIWKNEPGFVESRLRTSAKGVLMGYVDFRSIEDAMAAFKRFWDSCFPSTDIKLQLYYADDPGRARRDRPGNDRGREPPRYRDVPSPPRAHSNVPPPASRESGDKYREYSESPSRGRDYSDGRYESEKPDLGVDTGGVVDVDVDFGGSEDEGGVPSGRRPGGSAKAAGHRDEPDSRKRGRSPSPPPRPISRSPPPTRHSSRYDDRPGSVGRDERWPDLREPAYDRDLRGPRDPSPDWKRSRDSEPYRRRSIDRDDRRLREPSPIPYRREPYHDDRSRPPERVERVDGGVMDLPPDACCSLFVDGFPADATEREIAHVFRSCAGFKEVRMVSNRAAASGQSSSSAISPATMQPYLVFVEYETPTQAFKAIRLLDQYTVDLKKPMDGKLNKETNWQNFRAQMLNDSPTLHDVELGRDQSTKAVKRADDLDWGVAIFSMFVWIKPFAANNETVGLLSANTPSLGTATPIVATDSQTAIPASLCGVLSVSFYSQYFNVDTQDVVARLRAACVPFGPVKFTETTGANPDIYGPFWLCATLVFVIGVTSNMASWLNIREDQLSAWHYDFSLMTFAGFLVYGYVSVIPVVIWSALRYHGVGTSVAQLLCLYGYAQVVYIPAALACLTSSWVFDWLALMAAVGVSTKLIVDNTLPAITEKLPNLGRLATLALAATQVTYGLMLKLYFFRRA